MNTEVIEKICSNKTTFSWDERLECDEFIEKHFGRRAPFGPEVIDYITDTKKNNDKKKIILICCAIYKLAKKADIISDESKCEKIQMAYVKMCCRGSFIGGLAGSYA